MSENEPKKTIQPPPDKETRIQRMTTQPSLDKKHAKRLQPTLITKEVQPTPDSTTPGVGILGQGPAKGIHEPDNQNVRRMQPQRIGGQVQLLPPPNMPLSH